jgi:glycosyltransferase involved in cell wall biosynthesis
VQNEHHRIAIVHSFYPTDQPSGENEMVAAEVAALRRAGHDVALVARYTDQLQGGVAYKIQKEWVTATGHGPSPLNEIDAHDADVVHVHNLHPNYGRTWTRHLRQPLVVTLHNYRPLCAKAILHRDGRVCTDCLTGPLPGLVHACHRDSRRATLPLTIGQRSAQRDVLGRADRLIVLSPTQRSYYAQAGFDLDRMIEVPNFLPSDLDPGIGPGGDEWLYAGRLTIPKGVADLIAGWAGDVPLRIVGSGDDLPALKELARGKDIQFLGRLDRSEVVERLRHSRALAFPSRWPDPFGLVYIEALAAGTPVLATPPAAAASFIDRDGTGTAVDRVTPDRVRAAHEAFVELRGRCRQTFEARYTESAHVSALREVYASVA